MTPQEIQALLGGAQVYPQSVQDIGGETFIFAKDGTQHFLLIAYNPLLPSMARDTFSGEVQDFDSETAIKWCLPSHSNARKLRRLFPWTAPQRMGTKRAYGTGHLLGLAEPALLCAARIANVPVVLEEAALEWLAEINRTPEDAIDTATWAVFREAYQEPWGTTAHNIESEDDARRLAEAGFTGFILDVDTSLDTAATLEHIFSISSTIDTVLGKGKYDLSVETHCSATTTVSEHAQFVAQLSEAGLSLRHLGLSHSPASKPLDNWLREHRAIAQANGDYTLTVSADECPLAGPLDGVIANRCAIFWHKEEWRILSEHNPDLTREIETFVGPMEFSSEYSDTSQGQAMADYLTIVEYVECGITAKTEQGAWRFRDRVFQTLLRHEEQFHHRVEESAASAMRQWARFVASGDAV